MNIDKLKFDEKVKLYLQGKEGIKLSNKEKKRYDQCEQAARWIIDDGTDEAKKMCMTTFKVSSKVALRIMNDAISIYGTNNILTKDFLISIAYNDLRQSRKIALESGDVKMVVQADKNLLAFINKHFGDNETPEFDKIQPVPVMIAYQPEMLGIELPSADEVDAITKKLMQPKRAKKEEYEDIEIIEDTEYE